MFDSNKAFTRMTAVIQQPDCLLTAYRDDFYVLDKLEIQQSAVPGARFVWAIREHGTHLSALGLHPRNTAFVAAALDAHPNCQVYEIAILPDGDATILKISHARARELFKVMHYQVEGNSITYDGNRIACYDLQKEYIQGTWVGDITFKMDGENWPVWWEKPLETIGLNIFFEQIGTFFGRLGKVTFTSSALARTAA